MKELAQYTIGRRFLGPLAGGQDLIDSIERLCRQNAIQMASFTARGSVMSATLGVYDPTQQVYVTFTENRPLEIVACSGDVSPQDGHPVVHAHIALCDAQGNAYGGRLFSETRICGGDVEIQELLGTPLERDIADASGLMPWTSASSAS